MVSKRLIILSGLVLAGCVGPDSKTAFKEVGEVVSAHSGQEVFWAQNVADQQEVARRVAELLKSDLTAKSAVAVALLNNRSLQAEFEEIGISQADLAQASRLPNPVLMGSWRFPDRPPSATDAEYSISADFLSLLTLPARKGIATANLAQTKLRVADAVLKLAHEVQAAFYTTQAQQQLIAGLETIASVNEAAADLARRQYDAGNINRLTLAAQQTVSTQARVDLAQARGLFAAHREQLNRLLSLSGSQINWKISNELAPLPEKEPVLDSLESLALSQRLDLAAVKSEAKTFAAALKLKSDTRWLPGVMLGIDTERSPDGQNVTGPTLSLELPIFDQGQAATAKLAAQYRQAEQRYEALAVDVQSEVREAQSAVQSARERVELYQKELLPQRQELLRETLLQYNAMQLSGYELLSAKEHEQAAERGYTEALRDYWIARASLERAVGGRLPASAVQPTTTP